MTPNSFKAVQIAFIMVDAFIRDIMVAKQLKAGDFFLTFLTGCGIF